jgi:chemotaxis protein methyltransferase CheR
MSDKPRITSQEFQLLRDYIEKISGIALSKDKVYLIETRLTPIMVETGCESYLEFYQLAVLDSTNRLRDKIIEAITTNETYWFRDAYPFAIIDEVLLLQLAAEIKNGKRSRIKIWCTACSTGQEPYSIAMTVLEFAHRNPGFNPGSVEILATDISPIMLFLATAGRYDRFAIARGLSDEMKNRYFTEAGSVWVITEEAKRLITYKKVNLTESFSHFGRQDIIFCRNILIYFSHERKKDILRRIAALLRPGGYLFLGASEPIIYYSQEYEMMRHAMGLYYQVQCKE